MHGASIWASQPFLHDTLISGNYAGASNSLSVKTQQVSLNGRFLIAVGSLVMFRMRISGEANIWS